VSRAAGRPGGLPGRHRGTGGGDPFLALGLQPGPGLTDDEVRVAWRRVAAATHPDRADGGDPARFAEAAAAYTALRTAFGRGEALADRKPGPGRGDGTGRGFGVKSLFSGQHGGAAGRLLARAGRGRPLRLALRTAAALAACGLAVAAAGPHPAAPALVTGVLTWLVLTARRDLAPPPR
jgi:curved DNA-binding protein CbpA